MQGIWFDLSSRRKRLQDENGFITRLRVPAIANARTRQTVFRLKGGKLRILCLQQPKAYLGFYPVYVTAN